MMQGINKQLLAAAYATEKIFPDHYHDRITGKDSISEAEYLAVGQKLTDFATKIKVHYVYSFIRVGGEIFLTSSNAEPDGTYVPFFEPYDPPPALLTAFQTREPQFAETRDVYGHFRSVFIPLQNAQGRQYVVGADVTIGFVHQRLRNLLVQSAVLSCLTLAVFLSATLWLISRVLRPLSILSEFTDKMVASNFAEKPAANRQIDAIASVSKDEVGRLAQSFRYMQEKLQEHISNLQTTTAAKERIESELKIGREIQMGILPKTFPPFPDRPDIDIHSFISPAREVGGDLYDYFFADENHLCFAIGDVSDKGVPAALFMAVTKTLLKTIAVQERQPDQILRRMNATLFNENKADLFVTLFCGILNTASGELVYCNAGQTPPFLFRANGTVKAFPKGLALPLAVVPDFPYQRQSIHLHPGDALLLYTDGLSEVMDEKNNEFGVERIESLLKETDPQTAAHRVVEDMIFKAQQFSNGASQQDDITALFLRFAGPTATRVSLVNDPGEHAKLRASLVQFGETHNLPQSLVESLGVSLDELFTNILTYAYSDSERHRISLQLQLDDDVISATLRDDGNPFDPTAQPAPDVDSRLMDREIGGLGIHLVRRLMDSVTYQRDGNWNVLTLKKRLPSVPSSLDSVKQRASA
jgi:sigma-B regulation protein RsbU (phosphoserine phosphatase)